MYPNPRVVMLSSSVNAFELSCQEELITWIAWLQWGLLLKHIPGVRQIKPDKSPINTLLTLEKSHVLAPPSRPPDCQAAGTCILSEGEAAVKKCRSSCQLMGWWGTNIRRVASWTGYADIHRTVLRYSEDAWECLVHAQCQAQKSKPKFVFSSPWSHRMLHEVKQSGC